MSIAFMGSHTLANKEYGWLLFMLIVYFVDKADIGVHLAYCHQTIYGKVLLTEEQDYRANYANDDLVLMQVFWIMFSVKH